jgi:hypothetical protein
VAYCPPPEEFDTSKPMLKHLGGSRSDHWNQMLCNQIINSGWFRENMPADERRDQRTAILAFLASVKPGDAVEGMIATQLYASHAAAMECYRRAMLPGQPLEAKQINLTLAAKLTRANATQAEALKKYRSKGQQKVIVEYVHVYEGGQAIVGQVTPGGSGKNVEAQHPCCWICRKPRDAVREPEAESPCQSPGMPNGRCRMHGGPSPGAPKGNQNAFKHGRYSASSIQQRRHVAALIKEMRETWAGFETSTRA